MVSENVEASLELSRMAMEGFGLDAQHRDAVLESCRERYRQEIRSSENSVREVSGDGLKSGG